MISTAIVLALGSALAYAVGNSMQHQAAGRVERGRSATGLWRGFVSSPLWLFGTVVGLVALLLHALALGLGEIARVQPFMILGVALAVPIRAMLSRRAPTGVELGTVGVAVVGLILVLLAVEPVADRPLSTAAGVIVMGVGALLLVVLGASAWRLMPPASRFGFVLALGAGVGFGVNAALMKALSEDPPGWVAWIGDPVAWAFVVMGVLAFGLNQSAYHFAPLAVTLPVLNVVAVLEAIVLGMVFFDEVPAYGPLNLLGSAVGLLLMVLSLRLAALVTHDEDTATQPARAAVRVRR
ncbi:DMT family transporter [Nocardioidaceae bacterium]|nr:DMT family transporter [Nocardioidaceae bacterium]